MKYFIGLDIGTSKIGAVLIDSETAQLVHSVSRTNDSNIVFKTKNKSLWSEQSPEIILKRVFEVLGKLAVECSVQIKNIAGIGITGQMHGLVFVDEKNRQPLTNLITWEDKRCLSLVPDTDHTYLDEINDIHKARRKNNSGCAPSSGYMGCTLYWFCKNNLLPRKKVKASSIADFVYSELTGEGICTDTTNAAGSGVFNILDNSWDKDFINDLNIPDEIFPEVFRPGEKVYNLQKSVSEKTGLSSGIPVYCAVGDNQASVLGSIKDWNDIVINIGTGSQISYITNFLKTGSNYELRPFFDDKYLLVGAALCGGRAYSILRDFIGEIGNNFCPEHKIPDFFNKMNELAETVPSGSDGLFCDTRFEGTRENPKTTGAFTNISRSNFTLKHFCRSVLEGIAAELYNFHLKFGKELNKYQFITASGNAVRKNPLMSVIISKIFNLPVRIPLYEEEAAYGASLLSYIKTEASGDFQKIAELIKYKEIIYP